jgi:hypothetical protein
MIMDSKAVLVGGRQPLAEIWAKLAALQRTRHFPLQPRGKGQDSLPALCEKLADANRESAADTAWSFGTKVKLRGWGRGVCCQTVEEDLWESQQ